jgi:hypothetical protein
MHDQSLRKGSDSIYLGYEHHGDSIVVVDSRLDIHEGALVLKFTLKTSGDQRFDEEHLHSHELKYIQVFDPLVNNGIERYYENHRQEITQGMRVELYSLRKTLTFDVTKSKKQSERFRQLTVSDPRFTAR